LKTKREDSERELRERLKRAKAEGELPDDADPAALARFITTVAQGMSVQASGGATRKELERVVDFALGAWPS